MSIVLTESADTYVSGTITLGHITSNDGLNNFFGTYFFYDERAWTAIYYLNLFPGHIKI